MVGDPRRSASTEEARSVGSTIGLLCTAGNSWRQNLLCPSTQHVFLPQASHARARWECCCKFIEAMVEEWKAAFDAVRHRHPVTLGAKQIRREQRSHFEIRGLKIGRASCRERV